MTAKFLSLCVLAAVVSQGYAVTEVWLPDQTTTFVSNPLIGKSIGIGMLPIDTLVSCHVIFPNGVMYELAPTTTMPNVATIIYEPGSALHRNCGISFRNSPPSLSGTYELLGRVRRSETNTETLTRQRFHLTFAFSAVEFPKKA